MLTKVSQLYTIGDPLFLQMVECCICS